MGRGGRTKDRDVSERRCIVTGETAPKAGLIRFVIGPDNMVYPDLLEKLPGRGMWVTASRDALDKAGKGQFSKSAKQAVNVPDGLTDEVERQLVRRVVDLIALARKAGSAVCGFEKVALGLCSGRECHLRGQAGRNLPPCQSAQHADPNQAIQSHGRTGEDAAHI